MTPNKKLVSASSSIAAILITVLLIGCVATERKPAYIVGSSIQEEFKNREAALSVQLANVGMRYSELDRALVFDPKDFVDAGAIAVTKKRVADLEALITERDALLQDHFAGLHEYLRTAQIDESNRRQALDRVASQESATYRVFGELSSAERASMRVISDLLQLAERNFGRVRIVSGEPSFQNAAEAARLVDLLGLLHAAAAREKKATDAVALAWPAPVRVPGS